MRLVKDDSCVGMWATASVVLSLVAGCCGVSIEFSDVVKRTGNFKIGCPGRGPLTTVNSCFIICDDDSCENAKRICDLLPDGACNMIVRSRRGEREALDGQVVELKHKGKDIRTEQNRQICLGYGKLLLNSAFATRVVANQALDLPAVDRFVARNGTLLFLHMRKAGGTTLCALAKMNMLRVYQSRNDKEPFMATVMGKNCNPGFWDMHAWFGTLTQQIDWVQKHKIQFFENEAQLPREEDIPFGVFVTGTQFRHPLSRLYSLYLESNKVEHSEFSVSKITSGRDAQISSLCERVRDRYAAFVQQLRTESHSTVAVKEVAAKIDMSGPSVSKHRLRYKTKISKNFSHFLKMSYRNQDLAYFVGMKEYEGDREAKFANQFPSRDLLRTKRYQRYDEADFNKAIRILEKFSFVTVIEGINFLLQDVLLNVLGLKKSDPVKNRRGSLKQKLSIEDFGHDKMLLKIFLATANYDILLYAHATALSCLQYYNREVSRSANGSSSI